MNTKKAYAGLITTIFVVLVVYYMIVINIGIVVDFITTAYTTLENFSILMFQNTWVVIYILAPLLITCVIIAYFQHVEEQNARDARIDRELAGLEKESVEL